MKTEGYFVRHCEDPGCDLGTFHYTCPSCLEHIVDCDIWWQQDSILPEAPHHFECPKCGKLLTVEKEEDFWDFWVDERILDKVTTLD